MWQNKRLLQWLCKRVYFWSSLGRQGNRRDLYHEVWPSITVECVDCYWTFSRHKNGEHVFIQSRLGLNMPNYIILVYKILLIFYFSMYRYIFFNEMHILLHAVLCTGNWIYCKIISSIYIIWNLKEDY